MALSERRKFFRWATQSDATPWWYGDLYGDEIPTYEVFKMDWSDCYFDDLNPDSGRCFVIVNAGTEVGQVNYNEIHPADRSTEMDILIPHTTHTNQGIGTEAIEVLATWLFSAMMVSRIRIEVVRQNERACRAYEKAGFSWIYTYILNGIEWRVMERLAPGM